MAEFINVYKKDVMGGYKQIEKSSILKLFLIGKKINT